AVLSRKSRNRFPESNELRDELFERFVNRVTSSVVNLSFHYCSGEARNSFHSDMRSHFDCAIKSSACELALFRIERIAVERANGRDADSERLCFVRETFGEWFPLGMFEAAETL